MGPSQYFNMSVSVNKEIKGPWFHKYRTYGEYNVIQFGVLGLFVQFDYGFPK